MKRIESDALGELNKSLGLTGAGNPVTELHDGEVFQVLSIGEIARRGRSLGVTGGIFTAIIQNVHTDAETIATTITPYSLPDDIAIPPYPQIVPPQFDLWLLTATIQRSTGTGTMVALLDLTNSNQGFGIDDSGVQVIAAAAEPLAFWDILIGLGVTFGLLAGTEEVQARIHLRLARGNFPATTPRLRLTTTSSATANFRLQLTFGMFPASLGQDGAF